MGAAARLPVYHVSRKRRATMRLIARGCCVAAVGCLTLWVARRRPRTVGTTTTTTPRGFFLLPRIQSYCSAPLSSGREGLAKGELWGATVCIRHGARSAIHTELADDRPFDCALSPLAESVVDGASNLRPEIGPKGCLPGQLLDRGFEQHVALGTFFRNRYGGAWTANARSTDYQRTRASAAAFLTGFTGTPPASIESRSVSEPMLGVDEGGIACDRAARLAAAQRDAFVPAANLTPFWPNDDLSSGVTRVADAVYSRACEKQEPSCASGRCLDDPELVATLLAEADRHFCARYLGTRGGGEATRLSAYAFLREIVDGLLNRPARHLTLYSGHDTVVAPLAAALGFFDCRWPPLASRIVFELWQKNEVRILYNGIDVTSKVPGCDATRCPLPVLSAAVDALIAPAHGLEAACDRHQTEIR